MKNKLCMAPIPMLGFSTDKPQNDEARHIAVTPACSSKRFITRYIGKITSLVSARWNIKFIILSALTRCSAYIKHLEQLSINLQKPRELTTESLDGFSDGFPSLKKKKKQKENSDLHYIQGL